MVKKVGTVTGAVTRTPSRDVAPAPETTGGGSDHAAKSSAGAPPPGYVDPSIPSAAATFLRSWFVYVWPAVALSPIGNTLVLALAGVERGVSPPSFDVPSLASAMSSAAPGDSRSRPAGSPGQAGHSEATPFFSRDGGGMTLLAGTIAVLAALIGLVTLARLTVGEEFFSLRWLR